MGIGSAEPCDCKIPGLHLVILGGLKGRAPFRGEKAHLLLKNVLNVHIFTCMLGWLQNRQRY